MLEILDQSTARKTRHRAQEKKKQTKQKAGKKPGQPGRESNTRPARPTKQTTQKDKNQGGKRDPGKERRGEGDVPPSNGAKNTSDNQQKERSTISGK